MAGAEPLNMVLNFSSLWISFVAVLVGLAMLIAGGELLVSGAVRLAVRQKMSSLLIGLTVVAFGTSLPELFVSLNATFQGYTDVMVGNVVGSNIANVGLILGFSALLVPIRFQFRAVRVEIYLFLVSGVLLAAIAVHGQFLRLFGFLYVAGILIYTIASYRIATRRNKSGDRQPVPAGFAGRYRGIALFIIGGLLLMGYGSDYFIAGAVDVGRYFAISELMIGLTLAAIGTSLPELATSISAIRRRQGDLLLGNVLGSNLFNLLMVMGTTALITPFTISQVTLVRDLPVMLGFVLALIPMLLIRQGLGRVDGFLLLSCYAFYLLTLS
jgi:cation:H+ antiporter